MLLKTHYGVVQMPTPQEYLLTEKEKKDIAINPTMEQISKNF